MSDTDNSAFSDAGFRKNTPIQLILFISSMYIIFQSLVLIVMLMSDAPKTVYITQVIPYTGIYNWELFLDRPYTALTYAFCNRGFFVLVANGIWLFVASKVVVGAFSYKEVIPAFIALIVMPVIIYTLLLKAFAIEPYQYITGGYTTILAFSVAVFFTKEKYIKVIDRIWVPRFLIFILLFLFTFLNHSYKEPSTWVLVGASYLSGLLYFLFIRYILPVGEKIYTGVATATQKMTHELKQEDILGWNIDDLFAQIRDKHPYIEEEKLNNLFLKIRKDGFAGLSPMEKTILYRLMND